MATYRLPSDAHLLGYWGFDEANETDPALDDGPLGLDLTVTAAASVVPARLGNGRQFDGTNTIARPADSTRFATLGELTIIAWVILDSVNNLGDLLRPVLCFDGPTGAQADNTTFGLFVDNTGAIVYRYDRGAGQPVLYKTAPGTIRTGRYYSLALVQQNAGGGEVTVRFYLQNRLIPWASATVNGVPVADPNDKVPGPQMVSNPTGLLTIGGTQKSTSKWQGVVDEVSIHDTPRAKTPYLDAAYFGITQALQFTRLTAHGNVRTLGAVEMGGGTRWWCYERDQSIYVIRENSLGLFSSEILLTTGGTLRQQPVPTGTPMPGGVEQPRLAYDPVSDTLLVAFIGAGHVYKLTAASADPPATLGMPYSQDDFGAGILKLRDATDLYPSGLGEPKTNGEVGVLLNGRSTQTPAIIDFVHVPSFGIAVSGASPYGYIVYMDAGGTAIPVAVLPSAATGRAYIPFNYFFGAVGSRAFGATFFALPRDSGGNPIPGLTSNRITDSLGAWGLDGGDPNKILWNRYGDAPDEEYLTNVGEANARHPEWTQVSSFPVKYAQDDTYTSGAGEAPREILPWSVTNSYPIKHGYDDTYAAPAGGSNFVTMQRTGGPSFP